MKTVTKTITVSGKTSGMFLPNAEYNKSAEYNKRLIDSNICALRRMFNTFGFVSLNKIKQTLYIKDSFKQKTYLKECMLIHSKDDYETFEPIVSQDKDDPTKFKLTMQFVDYSKGDK